MQSVIRNSNSQTDIILILILFFIIAYIWRGSSTEYARSNSLAVRLKEKKAEKEEEQERSSEKRRQKRRPKGNDPEGDRRKKTEWDNER